MRTSLKTVFVVALSLAALLAAVLPAEAGTAAERAETKALNAQQAQTAQDRNSQWELARVTDAARGMKKDAPPAAAPTGTVQATALAPPG